MVTENIINISDTLRRLQEDKNSTAKKQKAEKLKTKRRKRLMRRVVFVCCIVSIRPNSTAVCGLFR